MTNETQAPVAKADEPKFRANSDFTRSWNHQGCMEILWRDGLRMVFNPAKASVENRAKAAQHGFEQRIGDSAAIEIDKISDKAERIAAKKANMQRLIDHYESGDTSWTVKQAARATGPDMGLLVQAMQALKMAAGADAANALFVAIAAKREIERDAVVKMFWEAPDIATKVAELRIAAKPVTLNAADLLAELRKSDGVIPPLAE